MSPFLSRKTPYSFATHYAGMQKIWYNSCETVCIIRQLSAGVGDQKIVEHFFDLMEESIDLLIEEA